MREHRPGKAFDPTPPANGCGPFVRHLSDRLLRTSSGRTTARSERAVPIDVGRFIPRAGRERGAITRRTSATQVVLDCLRAQGVAAFGAHAEVAAAGAAIGRACLSS
jgi:hypothetical protein